MDAVEINGKVLTEVPLLDEIVHNCKQLIKGIVLKDEDEALIYETFESLQNGDAYIAISEGKQQFSMFKYDVDTILKIPSILPEDAERYAKDNSLIPNKYKSTLLKYASEDFINNYEELNNYYRCLNGLPDYGTAGLYIDYSTIDQSVIDPNIREYMENRVGDRYVPIHTLSNAEIEILEVDGTLDKLRAENPTLKYLNHLGYKKISIYDMRKAPKFGLLYLPECDAIEVQKRFRELLEKNRVIFIRTIYSEAYKFQSDYYDKFMIIMIIIQTMVDCVIELPEYIIRKDVFDSRTVQYIFESNGVEYFPDIPLKYQVALVRNLNKLIKFKATDKCIIDICSIFGFNNIKVFKYYILKDRNVAGLNKDYLYNTKEPIDPSKVNSGATVLYTNEEDKYFIDEDKKIFIGVQTTDNERTFLDPEDEDENENYDIQFIKVPIDDVYDNYIRTNTNIYGYDSLIDDDPYWNGDRTRDEVLEAIKKQDFTVLRSKYISIEAVYDLTELTFQMCYFMNILFHNDVPKDLLLVKLPNISNTTKFNIVDVFILLYSMGYLYNGSTDNIMDTQGKVLSILGFNFEADLTKLGEYLLEKGYTMKDLGIDGFIIPSSGILSFNQLMEIYTTNKDIYQHVVDQMVHPESKEIYDIYKYIYESLMITRLNLDYYQLPDGSQAKTFTQFLRYKSPVLYAYLMDFKNEQNVEIRKSNISNAVTSICSYLEDYLDTDVLNYIFSNLPSVSLDFIKNYISHVINFFKSYKVHLLNISIAYKFDDKLENTIPIIDWMILKYIFEKSENIDIVEYFNDMRMSTTYNEKIDIVERMYLDISIWVTRNFTEDISAQIMDMIYDHIAYFESVEEMEVDDKFYDMLVSLTMKDTVELEFYHELRIHFDHWSEDIELLDNIASIMVQMTKKDNVIIEDSLLSYLLSYTLKDKTSYARERINDILLNLTNTDRYTMVDNYYLIPTVEL